MARPFPVLLPPSILFYQLVCLKGINFVYNRKGFILRKIVFMFNKRLGLKMTFLDKHGFFDKM